MATEDLNALTSAQWSSMAVDDLSSLSSPQLRSLQTDDIAAIMIATGDSVSPIVIDLEGDGLQLLSLDAGVRFDIGAEGKARSTGWVSGSDGLLARDLNRDDQINSGAELFGEATRLMDGREAKDGFEALRELDANQDHRIDESDWIWGELLIWRDLNSDGVTDEGELQLISQSGVASISLHAEQVSWWQAGNEVRLEPPQVSHR
ncbi:MAG: hypothetical protein EB065_11120 [Betaproteobacteria bacterium]|nr:hypothetical protein [Betaproteobacteria bacterium]